MANLLAVRLGPEEIRTARFTAIPRGGFVILGLIAPLLALTEEQFLPVERSDRLLVVLDDCALSGARFRRFLDRASSHRILFAPLVAPLGLRTAIKAREPRVVQCLSAEDVRETPEEPSPEHLKHRQARIDRGDCYWLGSTEALCFPWNEPDRTLWNSVTGRLERAWRIVPPELCAKNRLPAGSLPLPVQIQAQANEGPLCLSPDVLYAEIQEEIALCDGTSGQIFRLEGAGADLWRGLARSGNLEDTIVALRDIYEAHPGIIERDVRRLADEFLARGLVKPRGAP